MPPRGRPRKPRAPDPGDPYHRDHPTRPRGRPKKSPSQPATSMAEAVQRLFSFHIPSSSVASSSRSWSTPPALASPLPAPAQSATLGKAQPSIPNQDESESLSHVSPQASSLIPAQASSPYRLPDSSAIRIPTSSPARSDSSMPDVSRTSQYSKSNNYQALVSTYTIHGNSVSFKVRTRPRILSSPLSRCPPEALRPPCCPPGPAILGNLRPSPREILSKPRTSLMRARYHQ